jgi:hypothetical protein
VGLPNQVLIEKIRAIGLEVNNHMSSLDADDVARIMRSLDVERRPASSVSPGVVLRRLSAEPASLGSQPAKVEADAVTPTPAISAVVPVPAESVPQKLPLTPTAKLAWMILALCALGWCASFVLLPPGTGSTLVRHALEGAVVGGLCDAFAIWKTYEAVERNYGTLSHEVARFVVREIVRPEHVVSDMRAALDTPATTASLLKLVKEKFPSRNKLRAACLDFWEQDLRQIVLKRMGAALRIEPIDSKRGVKPIYLAAPSRRIGRGSRRRPWCSRVSSVPTLTPMRMRASRYVTTMAGPASLAPTSIS